MSYSHYNSVPGWGTNQVRFGAPPAPAFQPQPSWGGIDYYRAHAPNGSPDLDVYGHAWDRVRDVRDFSASGGLGVGIHEAQHWHRRAYGGLIDLNELLPAEIGHAAAYEAFRTWIHNSSIYEPLSGEMERQREGLIGLAVAEAMRLLGFTAHTMDPYFRRATSEAAAMTSSILFYWNRDHGDDERRGRGRGSEYDDPYAYDNDLAFPRRGRSHSRRRSHSVSSYNGIPSMAGSAVGMAPSAMPPTPYPGQVATYAGQGQPGSYAGGYPGQQGGYGQAASYGGYAGQAGSYGGQQGAYGGQQGPYGAQYPGGGAGVPMTMPGAGYASSDPAGYGTPYHGQSNVPMVAPVHGSRRRALSTSVPYAGTSYGGVGSSYGGMGSSYGGGGMIQGLPQPINGVAPQVVVVKSHRKHRHHHHSKHRSRSHSRY